MENTLQILIFIVSMIFLNAHIYAQTADWKTTKTEDGKITAKYNITEQTDENGDHALIEYTVTTTDSVSMKNLISVLKDVSNHAVFHDDEVSKKVNAISDNEWVLYYYNNAPWPMPDSDNVVKMTILENERENMAVFTLTAVPSMYEKKDVIRMAHYNETITFKELSDNRVEITVTIKMIPPMEVPNWILQAAFPDAAYDVVRKIVKLAKEI